MSGLALGLGTMVVACGGSRAPAGVATQPSAAAASPSNVATAAATSSSATRSSASASPVWRRLTPRGSVGEPNARELVMLGDEWFAVGYGAYRSKDGGRSWSDESSQIPTPPRGTHDSLSELTIIGDHVFAVSDNRLFRSGRGEPWSVVETPALGGVAAQRAPRRRHLAVAAGVAHLAVGDVHLVSRDGGQHWLPGPAKLPMPSIDALIATPKSLFSYVNVGSSDSLMRSSDQGRTWKDIRPKLRLGEDETLTCIVTQGSKLYAATTRGAVLISSDEGEHYSRYPLTNGVSKALSTAYQLWPIAGGLLVDTSVALLRVGEDGVTTQVYPHRVKAVASQGAEIVLLSASYLSHSRDGGRSFSEERPTGFGNDVVMHVTARGSNIGVLAAGPTVFLSSDGGGTFHAGPDVSGGAEVVASDGGFYVSTKTLTGAAVLQVPKAGAPERELTSYDFGAVPPRLFGTAGEGLAMYAWGRGQYLVSRNQGQTFTEVAGSNTRFSSYGQGWLQGGELLVRPETGVYRSRDGGPLEFVANLLPPDVTIGTGSLFREGETTYVVAGALYGWDEKTNHVQTLTEKLPLVLDKQQWVSSAAAQGQSLVVLVRSGQGPSSLFFSADRGRTWVTLAPPEPDVFVGGFAASAKGFIAETGDGVWLLSQP